jgi:cysteine desulfurase
MKRIYLDYAATTPVDLRVLRAMQSYFSEKFGNPGSVHSFGQEAIAAVDRSRETIANAIGAGFREVIFTASATEANNLALHGVMVARPAGPARIIVSAIEHESVLETARALAGDDVEVFSIPVDDRGVVDLEILKASLNERTVLVSIMYANNEIGTVQPIVEIAKIIKEFRASHLGKTRAFPWPLFHTDAAQAFQFFDCNVDMLGVDLMTISSHKIYGPKGAGALYIRSSSARSLKPFILGGGQEFGLRSGTENVPAIVGFAEAVKLVVPASTLTFRAKEARRIGELRDVLWQGIKKLYPEAEWNGGGIETGSGSGTKLGSQSVLQATTFLPNILNVYFPGCAAQDLLTRFDLAGLAASSGSACRSRALESSYVIEALGMDGGATDAVFAKQRAKESIRFSLGRPTTAADIAGALKVIKAIVR